MEKLFQALRDQHDGCEVLDVRFLVNQHAVADQEVSELDEKFAEAIHNAKECDLPQN